MTIVYNGTGGILGIFAILLSIILSFCDITWNPWGLLVFCSILTLGGGILELTLDEKIRPRYFFLIPAWLIGICGIGLVVRERYELWGNVIFAGILIPLSFWIRAESKKPGGMWVFALLGSLILIATIQILMQGEHGPTPSIGSHIFNGAGILLFIFSLFKIWFARKKEESASA
ncbi:hypothetical protein JWG45_03415 [Leptospira sp. 201903070]|uniref:DUF308 domain-containing protein n=1 Tax=Leptospira ainlahdjerensis TaxID=2810033 RepID=A0ABS2U757_9LEPT|nr:hypothetical protein [Leptospira ainlahdjerensis]MBM9576194.1 hypothetical protein [Leptospira ainlahdjerensis]